MLPKRKPMPDQEQIEAAKRLMEAITPLLPENKEPHYVTMTENGIKKTYAGNVLFINADGSHSIDGINIKDLTPIKIENVEPNTTTIMRGRNGSTMVFKNIITPQAKKPAATVQPSSGNKPAEVKKTDSVHIKREIQGLYITKHQEPPAAPTMKRK